MNHDVAIECACGRVRGRALDVSPAKVNRVMCYCRDCRAFARWLERPDMLDAAGGSDIVQLARARAVIDAGVEELRCMRLSEKGMHRWYTACCRTPMGNTIPKMPFIGLANVAFKGADLDALAGPALPIQLRSATRPMPGVSEFHPRMFAHIARLALGWWIRGLKGDTFFDPRTNAPRVTPQVLTTEERARLADR